MAGIGKDEAERFGVRWELAVQAWPKPVTVPAKPDGTGGAAGPEEREAREGDDIEAYEDDPTLPWWDAPPKEPEPPSRRLLVVAGVLVVALMLLMVVGMIVLG